MNLLEKAKRNKTTQAPRRDQLKLDHMRNDINRTKIAPSKNISLMYCYNNNINNVVIMEKDKKTVSMLPKTRMNELRMGEKGTSTTLNAINKKISMNQVKNVHSGYNKYWTYGGAIYGVKPGFIGRLDTGSTPSATNVYDVAGYSDLWYNTDIDVTNDRTHYSESGTDRAYKSIAANTSWYGTDAYQLSDNLMYRSDKLSLSNMLMYNRVRSTYINIPVNIDVKVKSSEPKTSIEIGKGQQLLTIRGYNSNDVEMGADMYFWCPNCKKKFTYTLEEQLKNPNYIRPQKPGRYSYYDPANDPNRLKVLPSKCPNCGIQFVIYNNGNGYYYAYVNTIKGQEILQGAGYSSMRVILGNYTQHTFLCHFIHADGYESGSYVVEQGYHGHAFVAYNTTAEYMVIDKKFPNTLCTDFYSTVTTEIDGDLSAAENIKPICFGDFVYKSAIKQTSTVGLGHWGWGEGGESPSGILGAEIGKPQSLSIRCYGTPQPSDGHGQISGPHNYYPAQYVASTLYGNGERAYASYYKNNFEPGLEGRSVTTFSADWEFVRPVITSTSTPIQVPQYLPGIIAPNNFKFADIAKYLYDNKKIVRAMYNVNGYTSIANTLNNQHYYAIDTSEARRNTYHNGILVTNNRASSVVFEKAEGAKEPYQPCVTFVGDVNTNKTYFKTLSEAKYA